MHHINQHLRSLAITNNHGIREDWTNHFDGLFLSFFVFFHNARSIYTQANVPMHPTPRK